MPVFDLSDDEAQALIRLLRRTLDDARYPHASRLHPLKAVLAKLKPSRPADRPSRRCRRGWGRAAGAVGGADAAVATERANP
jgi:hypothetical protein